MLTSLLQRPLDLMEWSDCLVWKAVDGGFVAWICKGRPQPEWEPSP